MSSNEEDLNDQDQPNGVLQGLKKRRIQRACDICRRKKIKCDGVQMPGNRCSNCVSYNYECTYVEAAKKRGPPKGYVESLENRLEKLDKLLRRLCPDESFLKELDGIIDNDSWVFDREQPVHPSPLMSGPANAPSVGHLTPQHPRDIATSVIRSVGANIDPEANDEDTAHIILADNLSRQLAVDTSYRFFGKSSGAMLVQTAIDIKNEYTGSNYDLRRAGLGGRRPEFWLIRPWERTSQTVEPPEYIFPDDDLITDLTDLYFQHVNLYLPLLHRPTFEKSLAEGLHRQNDMFGATLLLVCAVGSRFSHDPRVLLDGEESYHSCGWKWFDQVQMVKKSLLAPPSLYDLQFYCLSVQFLQGSSAPQSCWTMVGIGIRLAQDVGAHRRRAQTQPMTPEDELWKRAFWVMVCMDRMVSAALGRPCAIQDEDFDLDMPIECDDEYWDHPDPEKRFKQPPNKPSVLTAFILYLKLNQVLAFSLRTIYSINKSKILLGFVGQQWEQHIVAELDSALNKWVDSVPDHLRWDPNREDDNFFNQSVLLYASYYHIQILIHRPFIPSPKKPSPLSFPSLAICTNAARSCSHVVDMQRKRNPMPLPQVQMCVFTAGIVLLLSIWGGKRSGLSTDPNKEMADVYKCMQVLRVCEERWHSAGRLWDILYELASVGELPLPHSSPVTTNKRERDAESPMSAASICDSVPSGSISLDTPRNIAGLRRVSGLSKGHAPQQIPQPHSHVTGTSPTVPDQMYSSPLQPFQPENPRQSQEPSTSYQQENQQLFTLPVYSNELGRIPLHGQVKFSPRGQSPLDVSSWYPSPLSTAGDPMPSTSTMQTSFPPSDMTQGYSLDQSGMMFDQMGLSYQSGGAYDTLPYRNGVVNSAMSGTGVIQQQQPHEQSTMRYVPPQQTFVDNDTIAMWSNAPTGFELDEWGTYLTNVSELTQGHHPHDHIPNDV